MSTLEMDNGQMHANVLYEVNDRIAWVTVDRPKVRNALDRLTMSELLAAFESAAGDESVRVVILTGSGEIAFVAGADINELSRQSVTEAREYALAGQDVLNFVEQLGKPVIAAVNGYALGGGCELAMAASLRIASENAIFGQPEVCLGLIPGFGGSQRLARLVGKGRALEILLTGQPVAAEVAHRIGLVNKVVPLSQLRAAAHDLASQIMSNAPLAVQRCLEAVHRGLEMTLTEGQFLEAALFGSCFSTEDLKEGTKAFLEKRAPNFKGR
jgi:enoyl-CoA hydratase/carnithine racemase